MSVLVMVTVIGAGCEIVIVADAVQEFESVTVTV